MSNMKKKIKSNQFLSAISILVSGSIVAQLITILVSPITTRLFSPYEFGIYTLISTGVSLFGPILCLKYDMSIITSKKRKDTYGFIKLCFLLSMFLSLTLGLIYGLLVFFNQDYNNQERFIFTLGSILLLTTYGLNNLFLAHNNKNSLYKLISRVTMTKSLTSNSMLLIAGLLKLGVFGMIISHVFGTLTGVVRQSRDIKKHVKKIKSIKWSYIFTLAKREKNQPLYNATSTIINTSVYSTINLFIGKVYSPFQLGLYSLSYRILGIPFTLISANIARVYFNSSNNEYLNTGNYRNSFKKTLLFLILIITPIMLLIFFLSPLVFSKVFGEEWTEAGVYVQLLTPMFGIRLITESLTTGFIISKKQNYELILQFTLITFQLVIFSVVSIYNIHIYNFLLMISGLYVVMNCIILWVLFKLSGKRIPLPQ